MKYLSGLIVGLFFGIFVKRSRFCMTGLVRDIYLERKGYNIAIIFTIIFVQGFIYHAMAHAGLVRLPSYLPPFSLLSVALGSVLFGIGAVMSCGCLTSTLVKCGDGRIAGIISLITFLITGYTVSAGAGVGLTKALRSAAIVDDNLPWRTSMAPVVICAVLAVVLIVFLAYHRHTHKPAFQIPGRYTGVRHVLFEAIWPIEVAAVLIGVLAGLAFLISGLFGRHFGFAIVSPLLSWVYTALHTPFVIGGCNPYDTTFGWGSMFVLGIALGSFTASVTCGEFRLVLPDRATAVKMVIGGVLMGLGGVWGQGCLIANGLVGTAQFSLKSWYALVFLIAGIWIATRVLLVPAIKSPEQ